MGGEVFDLKPSRVCEVYDLCEMTTKKTKDDVCTVSTEYSVGKKYKLYKLKYFAPGPRRQGTGTGPTAEWCVGGSHY